MTLRVILLLIVFLPSLPVCFIRPFYGVALWIILAFVDPQWYTFAGGILPWSLAVAIPTLVGFAVFSRGWGRLVTRDTMPLLLLWLWFGVTTIVSLNTPLFAHHALDTQARLVFVSKILLMTFVIIGVVDSFTRLRTLVLVIGGCFAIFVVKAIPFLILSGGAYRVYGPPYSMISDNNDFGLALNMTLPIYFFLARSESKPWLKRLLWALFFMTIPSILFTYSRGALIGLVLILVMMLLQLKQRVVLVPVIVFTVATGVLLAPEKWQRRMDPTADTFTMDQSAKSRLNAWTYSWRLANDYPLTGGGFDTFSQELFDRYAPNSRDVHGPHSIYFGVLAEHGFPGLFLYFFLVAWSLWKTRQIARRAIYYGDYTAANYAHMFQFSILGFLTSGLFLGRAYFDYFFAIVAGVIILKRLCLARWGAGELLDGTAPLQGEPVATSEMAEGM